MLHLHEQKTVRETATLSIALHMHSAVGGIPRVGNHINHASKQLRRLRQSAHTAREARLHVRRVSQSSLCSCETVIASLREEVALLALAAQVSQV